MNTRKADYILETNNNHYIKRIDPFEKCKKEEDEKLAEKVKLRLEAENRLNQKMSRDREACRLRYSGK